jgi:uncharacterized oligopeptide transporter (OPT) family protein
VRMLGYIARAIALGAIYAAALVGVGFVVGLAEEITAALGGDAHAR